MKKKLRLKRTFLYLGSLLLALIILLTLTFFFWLGPTVKVLAEKIGSKALGAPISMERLSINPKKGTLILSGFEIGNHAIFGQSNTVSLTEVSIAIDMETIFSDTLVIKEILIDSPYFVYEQNSVSDNITEYITNIFAFANIDTDQPKEPKKEEEEDLDKESKKYVVNHLRITDVKMFLANTDDPDLDIQVGLEELMLSMSNGVVQLKNLTLSDPGLLTTPHIFVLESVAIQLDPASIHSDRIIIEKVQITKPYAYYEQNSETDTVTELMRIADSFTSKSDKNPEPSVAEIEIPEPEPAPKPPATTVELRELVIDDIQLHIVNIAKPELSIRMKLEQLALSPTSGDIQLQALTLSNPKLLATPNLFELDAVKIKLDPASLTNSTIIIEDVQVIKPYAFLEQNTETDTVTEFMRIAKRIAAGSTSTKGTTKQTPPPEPKKNPTPSDGPPPIELHNLLVDDIQLKFLDTTHTNAPDGLQTMASIGNISVKLVEGVLRIESITIPNPAGGFITTNLFHLSGIDITIDPESVFSDQVVIHEIFINSPSIHLEQTETTGNVAELQKIAEGFTPPAISPAPTPTPPQETGTTHAPVVLAEQPVVLDVLIVTNLTVTMTTPTPTKEVSGMSKLKPKELLNRNSNVNAPPSEDSITLAAFEQLSVELLKGLLRIQNLQIGNPEGFAHDNLAVIKQVRVKVDPDSIPTDTLLIEDILIDSPDIVYERQLTTDNIKALQNLIESATQKRGESLSEGMENKTDSTTNALIAVAKPSTTNEVIVASESETGQKVIIAHLLVKDGKVKAKLSALPTAPIPLPKIEMNDIGKEEGGANLGEAMSSIYGTFYDAIIGSVSSVTGFAGDLLKGAGALTFDALGAVSGGATDGLQEGMGLDAAAMEAEPEEKKKKKSRRSGSRRRFL